MGSQPAEFAVLGADGQLAREFLRVLGGRALGLRRAEADLTDAAGLEHRLGTLRPAVVINCAAFNHVDRCESERAAALAVNATGPGTLAKLAETQGFRLVHYSTDYVFGGDGLRRPRHEDDPPAPVNYYGETKLRGEQAVLEGSPRALVLRVAHVYGGHALSPGRLSLVERFVQLAREGKPVFITRGQWLNPTSVRMIVPATLRLLAEGASGLYHLTGSGGCEAGEFAAEVFRLAGLPGRIEYVERDERPARRAAYTVLENARWAAEGRAALPDWRTSLADALAGRGS